MSASTQALIRGIRALRWLSRVTRAGAVAFLTSLAFLWWIAGLFAGWLRATGRDAVANAERAMHGGAR